MLSLETILKVGRLNDQCGPGEDTFSPGYHLDNPVPVSDLPALSATANNTHSKTVTLFLGYVADPQTGDLRIRQYGSAEERDADADRIGQ